MVVKLVLWYIMMILIFDLLALKKLTPSILFNQTFAVLLLEGFLLIEAYKPVLISFVTCWLPKCTISLTSYPNIRFLPIFFKAAVSESLKDGKDGKTTKTFEPDATLNTRRMSLHRTTH